jgi:hypothetical protein
MPSRQYHAAFGAEKRDDAWADFVEAKLREYFARQRDTGHFAIVSLGCRSTLCEVLVVNRSPEATPGDVTRWQEIVFGLKHERWYPSAGIAEPSMEFGSSQDGRAMIVTYLLRAEDQRASSRPSSRSNAAPSPVHALPCYHRQRAGIVARQFLEQRIGIPWCARSNPSRGGRLRSAPDVASVTALRRGRVA